MKMQTTHAHPAQSDTLKSNFFVMLLFTSCIFFLKWCIENHMITHGFVNFLGLFFDSLIIKAVGSYFSEIVLLVLLSLAAFGLYCLIRYFWVIAVVWAVLLAIAAFYFSDQHPFNKPLTLKQALTQEKRADSFENIRG